VAKTVSYAQWSLEPYCIGMKLRTLRTQKRLTFPGWRRDRPFYCAPFQAGDGPHDSHTAYLPPLAGLRVGMSHFFAEPAIICSHHPQGPPAGQRPRHGVGEGDSVERAKRSPSPICADDRVPSGGTATAMETFANRAAWSMCSKAACNWRRSMCEVLEAGDCAYLESEMALAWSAPASTAAASSPSCLACASRRLNS